MLDFNGVGQQGTTAVGVIPPDSMVIVRLHIIMPSQGSIGSAVELTRSKSSTMEFLATELEVMEGQYKGAKIFHRFNVGGDSTPGQKKSVEIAASLPTTPPRRPRKPAASTAGPISRA